MPRKNLRGFSFYNIPERIVSKKIIFKMNRPSYALNHLEEL